MQGALWRWYLVAGALALGGFELLPSGIPQDVLYLIVGLSGVAAIAVGVHLGAPARKAPWLLLLAGELLWVLGDTASSWYEDIAHTLTFPSWADACYLAAYPVMAAGLRGFTRSRRSSRDVAGRLDSAILTVSLALLSWVLVAHPTIDAAQRSWSAAAVGVAYPLGDILLAGVLIRLVTTQGGRTPAFRWSMSAVGLLLAADTAYDVVSLHSPSDVGALNVLWLASYIAWGVAALHPSMSTLTAPVADTTPHLTVRRLVALGAASIVAPLILVVQAVTGASIDVWAVAVGSAAMFLLVVARMRVAINDLAQAFAAREQLSRRLAYQAAHDALTELPNRAQALYGIESALGRAQRTTALTGLLFVDLDGFKLINDTFGHRAGDDVLRAVAARLQGAVRTGDMVARLGGDEFVVVLETLPGEAIALDIAERIVQLARVPISVFDDRTVEIGASVGVAVSQDGSTQVQSFLHEADIACYRAKQAGRGRVEVFDQTLRRELAERAELETALRRAISEDELTVAYQPISDLRDGSIHGYEALVRWRRPGIGVVSPDEFIPTAERSDLICDLDVWVLRHATAQLAQWTREGMAHRTIAINMSGRHICDSRVVDDVASALELSRLDPAQLILEITETVLIEDLMAIDNLHALRALGVAISIDDFGTGYNWITRLRHLPVDIIKVDRSFLEPTGSSSRALLGLIIQSAHTFGLPVVAEGIEHAYQLDVLRGMSCEYGQGFYLSRPLPAAQIRAQDVMLAQDRIAASAASRTRTIDASSGPSTLSRSSGSVLDARTLNQLPSDSSMVSPSSSSTATISSAKASRTATDRARWSSTVELSSPDET